MVTKTAPPIAKTTGATEFEEAVRKELQRVLKSKSFRQVNRLPRFLTFIVDETLAGRGDLLKEYPVGVDVFGKDSSFDPRMDPIVRVQARRLRMRLATYYQEEGQGDDIVIELPKGGYTPTFRRVEGTPSQKRPIAAALVSRNSVAILPFKDQTPASDCGYLCDGLTQEILHALTKVESIMIVSQNWDSGHADTAPAPSAAMVVTGSVRKSKDVVRITMQISDAVRGCFVWSHSADYKLGDVFEIQEEVARTVVETLRSGLLGSDDGKGLLRKTENLAAHNLYLQGRYHLSQRTEHGLRKALEFFARALEEDSQFAKAYAGMADAHSLLAHYGVASPAEVWTKAASSATQAVLLDDECSEAHASLGHVRATQDWDWEGAEREFRRALALDPRNTTAHHWYSISCLAPLGRLDEALEENLLARALDPVSSIIARDTAAIYYYKRDFDQALEVCDHTIEQNPHFSAAYWTLGLVQEQRGDFDEAAAAFQRAIELSPPSPRILGALGRTYAKAGRREEALGILGELHGLARKRYISPFEMALIYFALDRLDEGFETLSKAFADRCFELISIKIDPRFDSVRKDPRFAHLYGQLGLP